MNIRPFVAEDFGRGMGECLEELAVGVVRPEALAGYVSLRVEFGVRTFVAVDEAGSVVGTASVFAEPKLLRGGCMAAHVEDVAVRPDAQGKGVGAALVKHCVEYARVAGCYKVVLNCDPKNVPFYEKCGFRVTPDAFMRIDL